MSIHHGVLSKSDKTDLSDVEKRLKALETLTATMNSNVKSNETSITTNKNNITSNYTLAASNLVTINSVSTKATNAYNKAVSNGDKILKKVSAMQNFAAHFTNPSVGTFTSAEAAIRGYGDVYYPLLHRTTETYIHLQIHIFDNDTTLDGTEKCVYRITFLDSSGNTHNWDSPTQTISSKRLLFTAYEVDMKMQPSANYPQTWDTFRAFKVSYKPIVPSKVNGNESVLHICVYSA